MNKILNLTQHKPTPAQIEAGVIEPDDETKAEIKKLLTFDEIPLNAEIIWRARELVEIVKKKGYRSVMIGGATYLMPALVYHLRNNRIAPLFAFSKRRKVEEHLPNGTVKSSIIFDFRGFVKI